MKLCSASVLMASYPSLTEELREELLVVHAITPMQALRINDLVQAWGREPNDRMGPGERKASLRGRILAAIGVGA